MSQLTQQGVGVGLSIDTRNYVPMAIKSLTNKGLSHVAEAKSNLLAAVRRVGEMPHMPWKRLIQQCWCPHLVTEVWALPLLLRVFCQGSFPPSNV